MKTTIKSISFTLFLILISGCTKEQIYRSIYEGAATQEKLKNDPEPLREPMTYDQYQREINRNKN